MCVCEHACVCVHACMCVGVCLNKHVYRSEINTKHRERIVGHEIMDLLTNLDLASGDTVIQSKHILYMQMSV